MSGSSLEASAPAIDSPRPPAYFRITVAVTAVALLVQAVTAGMLLSSVDGGRMLHGSFAGLVFLAVLVQLIAAIVARRGGAPAQLLTGSAVLFAGVVVQFAAGMAELRWLHIPLGVLLWGGVLMMLVHAWVRRTDRTPAGATA